MPIYEFCCSGCGNRFEELVRSSDKGAKGLRCPACGSNKVERLLSSFSFKSAGGSGPAAAGNTGNGCGSCSKTSCSSCG
ncbi:MAG: FmdB family zinc ribbon protein [Thermoleophilia bacterium]